MQIYVCCELPLQAQCCLVHLSYNLPPGLYQWVYVPCGSQSSTVVYVPMPADQNHQQLRLCSGVRSFQQAPQAYKARRPTVPRLVATTGWSTTPTPPGCAEIVLQAEGELSLSGLRTRRRTRCPRDLPRGCGVESSFPAGCRRPRLHIRENHQRSLQRSEGQYRPPTSLPR